MPDEQAGETFDFVVIGSGFGGSVAAMRLAEKGYSVLVLERGKRYEDQDFARTNWQVWKYLWAPFFRCFRHIADQPVSRFICVARCRSWRWQPGICQCVDGTRSTSHRCACLETSC